MVSQEQITEITNHPLIIKFSNFLINEKGEKTYPSLKELDLLKIPDLVRCIWKIDYSEDSGGTLQITFTGSDIDKFWKINASTAGTVEELYDGKDYEEVIPKLYKRALQEGKIAYTKRIATIHDREGPRRVNIEAIFFPCASDGKTIDSGIGIVDYFSKTNVDENIYRLL